MRTCPRCGAEGVSEVECSRCGVVYAKLDRREPVPATIPRPPAPFVAGDDDDDDLPADGTLDRRTLIIIGAGAGTALLAYLFPLTRFILTALVTLFHETGHAVAGWLMGHPSLPSFDFVYGGGLTNYGQRQPAIVILVGLAFIAAGRFLRARPRSLMFVAALAAVWLFFVSAEWRREFLMASAGHLSEFILAAVFFYQAISGHGLRRPELERPLAGFAAFFVAIHSIAFARRLRNDPEVLSRYREGKGGMLMNDLESVALDLKIHLGWDTSIESTAGWLLLFSAVPFAVALLWHFERRRVHRWLRSL